MDKRPIGVFDSGVGGLTVLNDLIEHYPDEDFIYLADTANYPYGLKSKQELETIIYQNINYLETENVKAIVIACNTASSIAIKAKVPIISIIAPTAKRAFEIGKKILVLATDYTISSEVYQKMLDDKAIGLKCSKFVDIVEKGIMGTKVAEEIICQHLSPYKDLIDTIILGCTHFSLLTDDIISCIGKKKIIDSSLSIAPILKDYIKPNLQNRNGKVVIKTTGKPEDLKFSWFTKQYESISQIVLS